MTPTPRCVICGDYAATFGYSANTDQWFCEKHYPKKASDAGKK